MLTCRTDNHNNAGAGNSGNYDAGMNLGRLSAAWLFQFVLLPFLAQPTACLAQTRPDQQTVQAVFQAIDDNDTNALQELYRHNTNCVDDDYYGSYYSRHYPLLQAATDGRTAMVALLVKYGADPNVAGDTRNSANAQRTALEEAAQRGHLEICELLLAAGADPNLGSVSGDTALHFVFNPLYGGLTNQSRIAALLLDYGANPFLEAGYYKRTPIELEITKGDGKLVARMLSQDRARPLGAKADRKKITLTKQRGQAAKTAQEFLAEQGDSLLFAAAQRGELEAVQALLIAGVSAKNGNTNCPTLLQAFSVSAAAAARSRSSAIEQWHQAQARLKEDYIPQANQQFVSSLRAQEAAMAAKVESLAPERWQKTLEVFIQHGADYDAFAATALNDTNQAKALVSADKNVARNRDCQGQTPLHWAVQTDQPQMISFWINAGTPLAATNFARQTALHLAATAGKATYIKTLLAAQSPTGIRDTNGWTPLDAAIQAKQTDTIHLLLGDKSAPAHPERGLAGTLHEAAATGNIAALAALLETETNLEARNELGLTPLQVAVTKGHLAAAALLVDKGANLNVRDPDGNSLLHQIFLQDRFTVYDRPPTNWLNGLKSNLYKQQYIQYLTVGQYEQGPNPVLQGTSFLLACGLDAQATNHAGQTVMQLVTEEKSSRSVFFFDDDQEKLLKLLSGAGGNVDQRDAEGNTALHQLSTGFYDVSKVERMASLIASGADVNATNNLGQTPLHVAAGNIGGWDGNDPPVNEPFQLLIYHKANVNARDNQGRTPLDILMASDSSFKQEATALLIKAGAKLNQPDKEGMTPLHKVAASGSAFSGSTVQSLLDSGADPNTRDQQGRTPVHLLLTGEWPWHSAGENLQKLATVGADFSAKDNDGKTPLHYLAALGGQRPLFFIRGIDQIFVDAKVNFNARDNAGDTPLHIAAKTGTGDVFDWLVKQGAGLDTTNNAGETPRLLSAHSSNRFSRSGPANADTDIFTAAREGKLDALSALIKADPKLVNATNQFNQTPLRVAVMSRRTNAVEFLEQQGARWDIVSAVMFGQTNALLEILARQPSEVATKNSRSSLLHLAADKGDVETTEILLDAKADWREQDRRGLSPLGVARLRNQPEVAHALRQRGATENIFDVAYTGGDETAALLLKRDKSLAVATNTMGLSVVAIASGVGQAEVLKRLLDRGASAEQASGYDGQTPLHLAAIYNQTNTAILLIRRGAKVNAADRSGFTPLHVAALRGAADVAEILLNHKADLNQQMPEPSDEYMPGMRLVGGPNALRFNQESALHLAAVMCQTNMIRLLLAFGASVNAIDGMGRTPLDLAKSAAFPPSVFWIQRSFGRTDPLGIAEPPQLSNRNTIQDQQRVATALLEKAGGKDRQSGQRFGQPPGFSR